MEEACACAVEVGSRHGFVSDEPVLIQETNNTVVWLRPHDIVAKVGKWTHSGEALTREHDVCTALAAVGAPVVRPVAGVAPQEASKGNLVTLWHRLHPDISAHPDDPTVARSLALVHRALNACDLALPSFRYGLELARTALADDAKLAALPVGDRAFLRRAFDRLLGELGHRSFAERRLHGEPHTGNFVATAAGVRWLDFEAACMGPVEWDLAFLSEGAAASFRDVDVDLLQFLRTLNSARVATWCWLRAEYPEMRWHGQHHLNVVRSRLR